MISQKQALFRTQTGSCRRVRSLAGLSCYINFLVICFYISMDNGVVGSDVSGRKFRGLCLLESVVNNSVLE